jgi:hypothetical protein
MACIALAASCGGKYIFAYLPAFEVGQVIPVAAADRDNTERLDSRGGRSLIFTPSHNHVSHRVKTGRDGTRREREREKKRTPK